jgi:hypothetical protein
VDPSIVPIVAKEAKEVSKPLSGAIAGTLAEFWHGIVGDRVTAWRLRNAAKVSEKLEDEIAARGLKLRADKLPESFAFRWFEKASEEDEPELQALFAKLLANAMDGNDAALQRQNIDLVARMTPDAASMLSQLADKYRAKRQQLQDFALLHENAIVEFRNATVEDQFRSAAALLVSLGVLRFRYKLADKHRPRVGRSMTDSSPRRVSEEIGVEENLVLTPLGADLIQALFGPM